MQIYRLLNHGHLYQGEQTGPPPVYNADYSRARYDRYPTTRPMSRLRYALADKLFSFQTVLDVGYGNGDFLKYCYQRGRDCYAWDVADYPLPKEITRLDSPSQQPVDLVTFFDSLEHYPQENLADFLASIPAKSVLISLPWCHENNPQWFLNWKHRRENEHLHHLSASAALRILELAGYDPVYLGSPEDEIRGRLNGRQNILTVAGTCVL